MEKIKRKREFIELPIALWIVLIWVNAVVICWRNSRCRFHFGRKTEVYLFKLNTVIEQKSSKYEQRKKITNVLTKCLLNFRLRPWQGASLKL